MAFTISAEQARRVAEEFRRALDGSAPAYELAQLGLFDSEDEKFIAREIARKLYEPQLPFGDSAERRMVEKLKKLGRQRDWPGSGRALAAAGRWEEILGWYYQRRPVTSRTNKDDWDLFNGMRQAAESSRDWEKKWFAELMLGGLPERVADFRVDPLFLLKKITGEHDRIVRFRNVAGERTGLLTMNATQFHAPTKFREFCLQAGNYDWCAGEKEVQKLHLDVGRALAYKVVNQVASFGWLEVAASAGGRNAGGVVNRGIWFFGDSAWADGKALTQDEHGVYWYGEAGYQVSENAREGEFHQRKPRMRPEVEDMGVEGGDGGGTGKAGGLRGTGGDEGGAGKATGDGRGPGIGLREFFHEFCERLCRRMSGDGGLLAIGAFLAYAAGPEIYEKYSFFPGLWLHGQAESGKSTIMEWLMEIWGFHMSSGIILREKASTAVGLMQAADQYSNLPVWLDEFRRTEIGEDRLGVIHNAYNRGKQPKFNATGVVRVPRTTFVVSGESTTTDAATRGRYPNQHVKAAESGGETDQMAWFSPRRGKFFLFGRYLLQHRARFVELVLKQMELFHDAPEMADLAQRTKRTYAVSYAAWVGMSALLESHDAEETRRFRQFMFQQTRESSQEVVSELNVNVFWTDLITAWEADAIPSHCFKVEGQIAECAPGMENQRRWKSYTLYIAPEATLAALQMFLVKQHADVSLKQRDMQAQLSGNAYFLKGKFTKRFGSGKDSSVKKCWAIDLDLHPLGYMPASDEAVNSYKMDDSLGDPRMGPLYSIVLGVEGKGSK